MFFYNLILVTPTSSKVLRKYEKTLKLFEKIDAVVSSLTSTPAEWLAVLEETGEKELIIENFECWIGKDPGNTELWKVYLGFLRRQNGGTQRLLNVLFRFSRLFLEDTETLDEYKGLQKQEGSRLQTPKHGVISAVNLFNRGYADVALNFIEAFAGFVASRHPRRIEDLPLDGFCKPIRSFMETLCFCSPFVSL